MFKKKLYYIVHTQKSNLFSLKGFVVVYSDKKCHYIYGRYDLETFYTFMKPDKKLNLICLGGEYFE